MALEITAGQTTIRVAVSRRERPGGPFVVPNLTGATPRLTLEDVNGVVLYAKNGTVVSPADSSGMCDFTDSGGEVPMPAEGDPPLAGYAQVRITYADTSVDYFPRQGEKFPVLIYRPLGA
jgi:hypothetical protein